MAETGQVGVARASLPGWSFGDVDAIDWQAVGEGVAIKPIGQADGRLMALFRFDPGYAGAMHPHAEAEFTFVLEGDVVSNGVTLRAGQGYAAAAGTEHGEFRSGPGAVILSVFKAPG